MKRSNTSKLLNEWKSFLNEEYYVDDPNAGLVDSDSSAADKNELINIIRQDILQDLNVDMEEFLDEVFNILSEEQLQMIYNKYLPDGPQQSDDRALENDPDMST
jgi:hypothetical protein